MTGTWAAKLRLVIGLALASIAAPALAQAPESQRIMLSGTGPDDAVPWDFTIDGGMRAGEKAKIPVPSNWQQQGFGHYFYGYDKGPRPSDKAVYRRTFTLPTDWKDKTVRLVFDGVMTEASVSVNGKSAGATHQGGFNRFSFDVTRLVKVGAENEVVVEVSEVTAARETEVAERHGDYWTFGGVYRPVWIEASPAQAIAHVAIDGRANGDIAADVALAAPRTVTRVTGQVTRDGKPVGAPFSTSIIAGGSGGVRIAGHVESPALWSSETPNLYYLDVTLFDGDKAVHQVRQRFGFRTFEVREGDGLYLNGQRILLKGVNRHSFRPDTGRAISKKDAYDDVRLIRSMNMNAVRMSHYSPEESFLEAADELGLYVLDELSGWQNAHGTEVGRKLVRELVERDVNHPSIILWDNGNEGGWNRELDGDFALYDIQKRNVLHPWEVYGGIDTKHYPNYADITRRLAGKNLVMPTEVLHALFDGGGGAALDDFWKAITGSPRGAGAFIWNLADEGIARTDQGGRIDVFGTFAPDGVVGPRDEKEPSYFTIREIWSPVQIETPTLDAAFSGALAVRNHYDFTPLGDVKFRWEWVKLAGPSDRTTTGRVLAAGTTAAPAVAPHGAGTLSLPLPPQWRQADALRLTAQNGDETLWTWSWPVQPGQAAAPAAIRAGTPRVVREGASVRLAAGGISAHFDAATGLLTGIEKNGQALPLANGPRLEVALPKKAAPAWTPATDAGSGIYRLPAAKPGNIVEVDLGMVEADGWGAFKMEVSADGQKWRTVYDNARALRDGIGYAFPAQTVAAVRISNLAGTRKPPAVRSVRIGYEGDRFPQLGKTPAVAITTGAGRDPATGKPSAWIEAPGAGGLERARWTLTDDGTLALDYRYSLTGPVLLHGIGFDQPGGAKSVRARLEGPSWVWQNRERGVGLGVYDIAATGQTALPAPDRAGYFKQPDWVRFDTAKGALIVRSIGARYLQLGARLVDHPTTSGEFPASDIGFLNAIPGMGSKGHSHIGEGPQGAPAVASGSYEGRLLFDWR